jgi:hypothetical protein
MTVTFSWWQYAVAWGAAIVFIVWMILLTSEIITKLTGVFNRQGSTYNDYLVQQLYAENVNVRSGDPTTPQYGATHNASQRRRR